MIIGALIKLATSVVGPKFAKPVLIGLAVLLLVGGLFALKGCIEDNAVEQDRLQSNNKVLTKQVGADTKAAEERAVEQQVLQQQREELRDVQNATALSPADRRTLRGCRIMRQQGQDTGGIPACRDVEEKCRTAVPGSCPAAN